MQPEPGDALRALAMARESPTLALAAAIPVGGPDRVAFRVTGRASGESVQARAGLWARGTTRAGVEYGALAVAYLDRHRRGENDAGVFVGARLRW